MHEILRSFGMSEDVKPHRKEGEEGGRGRRERKEGEGENIYCGRQQEVHNYEYPMRIVTKAKVKGQSH